MMTLAPIRSAVHAATYFEKGDHSDYYHDDNVCPSKWAGKGSEKLAIHGQPVDSERFKRYLGGDIAGQMIGTKRNGDWQHKPGWDLQFSPSKSVSIVALVGGDQRIINAHDKAVGDAVAYLENKAAFTRVHVRNEDGSDNCHQVPTGNLVAAVFSHDSSRALDPQLHSHAVVINATLRNDNKWRSIDSRHFYALQKEAGLAYRMSLGSSLRNLGYSLERTADENFEIAGIPKGLISTFSQRRNQVDKKLSDLGYTRKSAPASVKEKVAHQGRAAKSPVAPTLLADRWNEITLESAFDTKKFIQCAINRSSASTWSEAINVETHEQLERLVKLSIKSLSERDAVFSRQHLERDLMKLAVGYGISSEDCAKGVEWALEEGLIVGGRTVRNYSSQFQCWKDVPGFVTPESIFLEDRMIESIRLGRSVMESEFSSHEIDLILERSEHESQLNGFSGWTSGQKNAVSGVLSSKDQFVAIQGYAGTAKTSTALKTISVEYERRGYHVVGMAPSSSACDSLAQGAQLESVVTVASHLLNNHTNNLGDKNQLWLVDEASFLSTKDMNRLVQKARNQAAKVVLVGDVKQLGSVDAGAAFRQLQDNGISTFELDEIVRQENEDVLNAVIHSLAGDAEKALDSLSGSGGKVMEIAGDARSRHQKIVEQYIKLPPHERGDTLILDPSREGRDQLNQYLRQALKSCGDIAHEGIDSKRLETVDLTSVEAKDFNNYQLNDVIKFGRSYANKGVDKNSYWRVAGVNAGDCIVRLTSSEGQVVIWNPLAWGAKSQLFRQVECELSVGDQLRWAINDRGLGISNGAKGVVRRINVEEKSAEIEFSSGLRRLLNLNDQQAQHWNYAYVSTVHAAQGKTAKRVICHLESFRRNLSSQKALYVVISRAKYNVCVYTDNKLKLIEQIKEHAAEKGCANEVAKEFEPGLGYEL